MVSPMGKNAKVGIKEKVWWTIAENFMKGCVATQILCCAYESFGVVKIDDDALTWACSTH